MAPGLNQNDQETSLLKKGKIEFNGRSDFIKPIYGGDTTFLPNGKMLIKGVIAEWYDIAFYEADGLPCWEVTGTTIWYINSLTEVDGSAKIWGKAELFVEGDRGKWDLSWHGYLTPYEDGSGLEIVADANGTGKEGEVKGMVGKWTYTMNFTFTDPATFFYATEGYIK